MRKTILVLLALWLSVCTIGPVHRAEAARITTFVLFLEGDYLIAGVEYSAMIWTDKNQTTAIFPSYYYSTSNGAIWHPIIPEVRALDGQSIIFRMPVDPNITSAMFRASAHFIPLLGSETYSEKIIGPVKILQPGEISNLTATANDDGSVTLRWNDNTNMESLYRITRSGPDGKKTFEMPGTKDHIGPLTFTDRETNKSKSTVYVYSITPVVEEHYDELPEALRLGTVWSVVKTKLPADLIDAIIIDAPIYIPDLKDPPDRPAVDPIDLVSPEALNYLADFNLKPEDADKKPVSGIQLDPDTIVLAPGESRTLTAVVTPADAANKNVIWSSSNPQAAEVDGTGKVTGKSPGFAIITARTEAGHFKDTAMVTVTEAQGPLVPADPAAPDPGMPQMEPAFPDIAGHPAAAEIMDAVKLGVVRGYDDGTFRPDATVTRAEFAVMLMRAVKPDIEGAPLPFKDNADIGNWAAAAVRQAVALGIIRGYDDGTFRPNATITRAEMIAMVIRASGLPADADDAARTAFSDDADIPKWAKPAVRKAQSAGIIRPEEFPGGRFAPLQKATRAEAASAIVRMLTLAPE